HRLGIFGHAQNLERGGTMVREVAVEVAPPAIFGRIDTDDRVAPEIHVGPVHLQVTPAAQRRRGLAGIYCYLLATPRAQFPEGGGGKADRGKRRHSRFGDAKGRRQYRIGAAGDLDRAGALFGPAGDRKYGAQSVVRHAWNSWLVKQFSRVHLRL